MLKIVGTKNGLVKGQLGSNARVSVFKGIPYAKPPIGENRWRAPLPVESWNGIRECYHFAPIAMQDTPGLGDDIYCKEWHVDPEIEMSEDCLYLNIWTPAKTAGDKLPVFVWIHGGAFQWGYSSEMEFDGQQLAKRGIVVVNFNYRLAALGFLAHPDLTKEAPNACSNFGMLDQLAALKWVKENIEFFGGDKDQITLGGQSAGGASVLSHLTSDLSKNLFSRAFIMSGIIRNPYVKDELITPQPLSKKEKDGEEFLRFLGVSTIEEARALSAYYIREKYAEFSMNHPRFSLTIDGHFAKEEAFGAYLSGKHNHVPLLIGNTTDEFLCAIDASDDEALAQKATDLFADQAQTYLSLLEEFAKDSKSNRACSQIEFASKCAILSNQAPSYYYVFDADIPGDDHPGTFHSVDLWFFFETLLNCKRPFNGKHFDLARQMCDYLANFIKTGSPNGLSSDGSMLAEWKPYTEENKHEMYFSDRQSRLQNTETAFSTFMIKELAKANISSRKQAFNPYLPSWEYIPDGEPYVFGDRVYIYGSHDFYNGHAFCLGDYVCWSAPINDLADWRYEGVIYRRTNDPLNKANNMCLYAPDITVGPDGRYYLYYVLDRVSVVSVAVCDEPAGNFTFLGYVHYPDGRLLGETEKDEPQFDPGVITVGDKVYLYTGFCQQTDASRHGCMVTELDRDMLTIKTAPSFVIPGKCYSEGSSFFGHAFFEAPSIRYFDKHYYLIYSSEVMHELCYAISDSPNGPFTYGGVLISNNDMHIDSYKAADLPAANGGNNHGSLVEIAGKRYIFYHRHTNQTWYSRQGCAEEICFLDDGQIVQSEMTSCGLNGSPLPAYGSYPTYIACILFDKNKAVYVGDASNAYIKQDGIDGDQTDGYITKITDSTTIGFKYFDCKDVKKIRVDVRGYATGHFEIMTSLDGEVLATIPFEHSTVWESYEVDCKLPNGKQMLVFKYVGPGTLEFKAFTFIH